MVDGLTDKQRLVFEAFERYLRQNGYPPSLADLAAELLLSRQTIHQHMLALKTKGYLDHAMNVGRSWVPASQQLQQQGCQVPILGVVTAGKPILAHEDILGWVTYDEGNSHDKHFALRVKGDSMVGVGILEGDLVIVRQQQTAANGDIVVALLDGEEATVKRFKSSGGEIQLVPENPAYRPITVADDRLNILGKVVAIQRSL